MKHLFALNAILATPSGKGAAAERDAALTLLFSLVASGQIELRRIDGWRKIATVLRQPGDGLVAP